MTAGLAIWDRNRPELAQNVIDMRQMRCMSGTARRPMSSLQHQLSDRFIGLIPRLPSCVFTAAIAVVGAPLQLFLDAGTPKLCQNSERALLYWHEMRFARQQHVVADQAQDCAGDGDEAGADSAASAAHVKKGSVQ